MARHRNKTFTLLVASALAGCGADTAAPDPEAAAPVGGEVRTGTFMTPDGPRRLTYYYVDGKRIFEGDILLPPSEEELAKDGVAGAAGRDSRWWRWPNNTIPFRFDPALNATSIANATAAMDHWEQNTSIRFVTRTSETNFVEFQDDDSGCYSAVGRQGYGRQAINLVAGCTVGNAIHEIGHAVGLWHEQSRRDRDAYVSMDLDCVDRDPDNQTHNYDQYGGGSDYGLYDFSSVMHYDSDDFFTNDDDAPPECDALGMVMWRRSSPSGTAEYIDGQRAGLSLIDRQGVEEMYSDLFGHALAVGDFNDDGFGDVAVGAPRAGSSSAGHVLVFRGSATGLILDADLDQGASGAAGDRFGYALASADFDDDGVDDLAIGVPGENGREGRVVVYRGRRRATGALNRWLDLDQAGLGSDEAGDRFGHALTAGDFDGDGDGDLAVGAPGEAWGTGAPSSGAVFLFRGGASLTAWQVLGQAGLGADEAGDSFGHALASTDFDGDGRRDLAVGAPHERYGSSPEAGVVFLFRGGATVAGWRVLRPIVGSTDYTDWDLFFGFSLATGDFDADGRRDLAVGAPGAKIGSTRWAGRVIVFGGTASGPTAGGFALAESAPTMGASFGFALAAGKYNTDGYADLAVGAPGSMPAPGNAAGRVYAYPGRGTISTAISLGTPAILAQAGVTSEPGDRFGGDVGFVDFDGDGDSDLAIGLPGELNGVDAEGRMDLFRSNGAALSWLSSHQP